MIAILVIPSADSWWPAISHFLLRIIATCARLSRPPPPPPPPPPAPPAPAEYFEYFEQDKDTDISIEFFKVVPYYKSTAALEADLL